MEKTMDISKYFLSAASIGAELKKQRLAKGYTQGEVAKKLKKSVSTISGYEAGTRNPDPETLVALCLLLGIKETKQFFQPLMQADITKEEHKIIRLYRGLDTESQQALITILRKLKKQAAEAE